MAPKKDPAPPPPDASADKGPREEEEEGPGRVAFCLEPLWIKDLPAELETCIAFSGACRENRSAAAEKSKESSGWELAKGKFIRTQEQALYDDLAERELVVSVLDAGKDNAVIGTVSVSLLPLMHESTELGGEFELKLTDAYYQKWFPSAEKEEEPEPAGKKGGKAKDAKAAPVEEEKPPPPPPEDAGPPFIPPPTVISFRVTVPELVGPLEDRDSWTTITLRVPGVFGLPERLTGLGLAAADDVENHQLKYMAALLGESFGDGALAKATEVEEPPAEPAEDGEPPPPPPEIPQRERQERFGLSVRFKGGERIVRYRGAKFLQEFRHMLNHVGGVWFYFNPEEKPSTDPKKVNAPEVGTLARCYTGKAWLDLSSLINYGVCATEASCLLVATEVVEDAAEEPTFGSTGAFVRLAFEMSRDITPEPVPPEKQVKVEQLATPLTAAKFPPALDATLMYRQAVERSFDMICGDCAGGVTAPGVNGVIEQLKKAGSYEEMKQGLRASVIQVLRERVRKETSIVPGEPLSDDRQAEFISGTYSYLKSSMADVLHELRKTKGDADGFDSEPPSPPSLPSPVDIRAGGITPGLVTPAVATPLMSRLPSASGRQDLNATNPRMMVGSALDSLDGGSPGGCSEAVPEDPVAAALAESAAARRSRGALEDISERPGRALRLAYEAEIVGKWDRAAELLQNRLALDELQREPTEWIAYAKFCMRSRGRQAAAEEALRQAVKLMADPSVSHTDETAIEVDLMLACLLLDRGREEEAIKVFRAWHEKDLADPLLQFFLGLGLFLTGEEDDAKQHLEAAGKPRSWFRGLDSDAAVKQKLSSSHDVQDPAPYFGHVEKLLDLGLASLAYTFLDQSGMLSHEVVAAEPFALLDAKASALDREYGEALSTLEPLLNGGAASQEAWRLAGECHFQLQDFDKALQAIQQAMAFETKFEDPAVYIRYGSLLVVKKRWKHARDAFLKSIQFRPTAEAWNGVAYAEYRSDELQMAYEALCEASLLDNQRADVWAQLCLVHLRLENWDSADHCFRQCLAHKPDCDELLLEVANEYNRRERQPTLAEAAARRSLQARDSGLAHSALMDALAAQGQLEQAVLEAQLALQQLSDQPEQRKAIFERALKLAEESGDPALSESLHAAQNLAEGRSAGRTSP